VIDTSSSSSSSFSSLPPLAPLSSLTYFSSQSTSHITVVTASGTCQTVSANFRCCGTAGTAVPTVPP